MTARAFVNAARKLKGARWRHRGRKPWAVDCVGLVVLAGRESGLVMHDEIGYGREPWEDRLRTACQAHWGAPLSVEDAEPGDISLIRWSKGEPSHMAVVGDHPNGGLTIIHANNIHGVVECSLAEPFRSCVVEIYRPWREGTQCLPAKF
jgi:hypothetical protein